MENSLLYTNTYVIHNLQQRQTLFYSGTIVDLIAISARQRVNRSPDSKRLAPPMDICDTDDVDGFSGEVTDVLPTFKTEE